MIYNISEIKRIVFWRKKNVIFHILFWKAYSTIKIINICCVNVGSKRRLNWEPLTTRTLRLNHFLNPTLFSNVYCIVALFFYIYNLYNITLNLIQLKRELENEKDLLCVPIDAQQVFTKCIILINNVHSLTHLPPISSKFLLNQAIFYPSTIASSICLLSLSKMHLQGVIYACKRVATSG
jgi:hypothetical protein